MPGACAKRGIETCCGKRARRFGRFLGRRNYQACNAFSAGHQYRVASRRSWVSQILPIPGDTRTCPRASTLMQRTAMLDGRFSAGGFHQNAAHRFRRGSKEVIAAVPVGLTTRVCVSRTGFFHQAHIGFVNKRGGLQRLPRPLVRQLGGSQLSQLGIHQRQQLFRRGGIAGFDLR